MKYTIMGVLGMVVILAVSLVSTYADKENPMNRYHQHISGRQPDAGCDCDKDELCTHLPLVIIDTNDKAVPGERVTDEDGHNIGYTTAENGESMLEAKVAIMEDESKNHHPSDKPDIESSILIRIRGNSSRHFDKKNYLIRFIDEEGKYQNQEVMGMDAHYEWAMHGPYLDKTLIRNYMWYNIAGEIMDYAPNVRFCEVILNGEYIGLYVMTETITNGEGNRLDISEPVKDTNSTGYLLRVDNGSSNPLKNIETFTEYTYRRRQMLDIQYPRGGELTQEMADAIARDFSDFEKSLYSYDYDTKDYGYTQTIDVESFVDYFILNEFTANYDTGALSTYIYRDIGGKYKMVIWDFNSACDNYQYSVFDTHHFELHQMVWYYMLTKDEAFVDQIIRRYRELRKTYLSEEYLNSYIDDVEKFLADAIDRNFSDEAWGYTLAMDMVIPSERNPRSHEEAVEQMKNYIHSRGEWMDENIEILRQYSHPSKNKKFNH